MTPFTAKDANGNQISSKEFLKILSNGAFKKDGLASLSKEDRAAVRRNLKELQFIAQFTLAILALSLVAGGDDDDKFAMNLMINFLSKAQADLTFFTNPSAMVNLGNNVAPIFSTVTNVLSITDVAWKTLSGSPSYENGPHKDQNRALVWAGKNMLFSNGAMRIYNWGDRVFEYN